MALPPEPRYRRPVPTIRGPVPGWIEGLVRPHIDEEVTPLPGRTVRLRSATVRGPGVITLPGGVVVRESLINCHDAASVGHLQRAGDGFVDTPDAPAPKPQPPGCYVLLKQMWDGNYGHWLVEGLPRVSLLVGAVDPAACRFLISWSGPAVYRVMLDSLAALGIRAEQVLISEYAPEHYDELIYPLPVTCAPWQTGPRSVRVLEQVRDAVLAKRGQPWRAERVFIWRPETSRRPLRNQAEICRMLMRRGYAVVTPALMSFEEQVIAFSAARIVVGTLGAECTNLAFAPSGVRIVGLAPEGMKDDFFWDLVAHKSGGYFSLHGASEAPAEGMNSPFSIDPSALLGLLDEAEAGL